MGNIELFITTVFMGFFAMTNPIGNSVLFISLTEGMEPQKSKSIALKTVIVCFIIVSLFALLGQLIFSFFQITLPAFRIMGGLLLMIMGYRHLSSTKSNTNQLSTDTDSSSIAITPLAFPMIAGPGTISAAMNFSGVYPGYMDLIFIVIIFAIICIVIYFMLSNAQRLVNILGNSAITIITKLMSLIVAVIGTQMVIAGVIAAFSLTEK